MYLTEVFEFASTVPGFEIYLTGSKAKSTKWVVVHKEDLEKVVIGIVVAPLE